ncbi:hypothetical protein [Allocoleopsis sp.]|uniref:hypothetical protein n=1 Tax=Allocoleopsis sp. TaxID=3088169 RepID=UPI002FD4D33C
MFAPTTSKSAPVLWQGKTRDGYTLRLTRSGLAKIVSNLQQTGLHNLVQNNLNGSHEAAVVRAIAQVVSNAAHSSSGQNTQVFTAVGKTRKYQILTQPIDSKQSAILFVRSRPTQEFEYEGEFENEYEADYFLPAIIRGVSAARKAVPAAKKVASKVPKAAHAARSTASTLQRRASTRSIPRHPSARASSRGDSTKLAQSRYNLKPKPMGFKQWKSGREAQHLIPKAVFKAHNMPLTLLNSPANGIMLPAGKRPKQYPIHRKPVKMGLRPAHIKKGRAHPQYNKKVTQFLAWAYPQKKGNWSTAEVERAALALRKAHKDPSMKGKFVDDIPLSLMKKYFR